MARSGSHRILTVVLGAGLFSFAAAGCVSQEDYTALKMDRDNLAEQFAEASRSAEANKRLADSYREQIARLSSAGAIDTGRTDNLNQQLLAAQMERDEFMRKYQELLERIGTGPALPEVLTNELTIFAAANSDLLTFDAEKGIVKFKSDVTFASGDAELTPEARNVIGKFAQILNGPVARNYELIVAGHTDNVPVSNPVTVSKGHKDNWYLSSHRAISVASALRSQGINATRLGVTGFADQRPVASNTEPAGRQQNRRVEVLILPTTVSQQPPATAATPALPDDAEMAGAPAQDPTK